MLDYRFSYFHIWLQMCLQRGLYQPFHGLLHLIQTGIPKVGSQPTSAPPVITQPLHDRSLRTKEITTYTGNISPFCLITVVLVGDEYRVLWPTPPGKPQGNSEGKLLEEMSISVFLSCKM